MDEVIVFDKSLQERLHEYMELFSEKPTKSVDLIKEVWIHYLEYMMDTNGWQAIWKIPRQKCQELNIPFPTLALVYIENIQFQILAANIIIITTQGTLDMPSHHQVPLLQLWPTKEQDSSVVLYIETTSIALDMYRFFYTNIFFPWDYDDDDSDWLDNNLSSRLRLYYDLKNGVIERHAAEHIQALLSEAKRLQFRRETIQNEIVARNIPEDNSNNQLVQQLMSLNIDMIEIKSEMELLENPLTRNIMIQRMKDVQVKNEQKTPQVWLIFEEGTVDEYTLFLTQLGNHLENLNEKLIFSTNLQSILDKMSPKDTLILNEQRHLLKSTSALETGGTLKGISSKELTILHTSNEDIMMDFKGDIHLETLTIDASNSQCAILVRSGTTTIKNCKIQGDNTSSTHQGIIVLKGGNLELVNCEISGFYAAIVGNTGSQISLKNCGIYGNQIGMKIYDLCSFKAENSKLHDCMQYGLCIETNLQARMLQTVGDFNLLETVSEVETTNLVGENNRKADVIINPIMKITPKTDLFSNPEFDPTCKHHADQGEMEEDMGDNDIIMQEKENPTPEAGDVCK